MPSDIGAMALSSLNHIGIVVKDVDKTTEFLSSLLGLEPVETIEYSPQKDEIIAGEPCRSKITFAKLGPVLLELLQPLERRGVLSQFLETNGEGIHHICYGISNCDALVSKLQEQGGKLVAAASYKGQRWWYFDTRPGGIVIELEENLEKSQLQ